MSISRKRTLRITLFAVAAVLTATSAGMGLVTLGRLCRDVGRTRGCLSGPEGPPAMAAPALPPPPGPAPKGLPEGDDPSAEKVRAVLAPDWIGAAASPRVDVAVVWSARSIELLDDFEPILPGPGDVNDVIVDSRGTVYAIRGGDQLGRARRGGPVHWSRTPFAGETLGLSASNGWLIWIARPPSAAGKPLMALSRDDGGSWVIRALPDCSECVFDLASASISPKGDIDLFLRYDDSQWNEEGGWATMRFRGRVQKSGWQRSERETFDPQTHRLLSSCGSNGRRMYCAYYPERLVEIGPNGEARDVYQELRGRITVLAVDHLNRPIGFLYRRDSDDRPQLWRWSVEDAAAALIAPNQ